jgi:hypothetical protein
MHVQVYTDRRNVVTVETDVQQCVDLRVFESRKECLAYSNRSHMPTIEYWDGEKYKELWDIWHIDKEVLDAMSNNIKVCIYVFDGAWGDGTVTYGHLDSVYDYKDHWFFESSVIYDISEEAKEVAAEFVSCVNMVSGDTEVKSISSMFRHCDQLAKIYNGKTLYGAMGTEDRFVACVYREDKSDISGWLNRTINL